MKTRRQMLKFTVHKEKSIMCVDFSGNLADEQIESLHELGRILEEQVPGPFLILEDMTGVRFNDEVIRTAKEMYREHRYLIKKVAIIGLDPLKKIVRPEVEEESGVRLRDFDSVEEAKDWLVNDEID